MTVSITTHSVKGSGNGANFDFNFSFEVYAKSELEVLHVDESTVPPTVTTVSEGSGSLNYSVVFTTPLNDGKSAGVVTYPADKITPMPSTQYIVITRVPPLTQPDTFRSLGVQLPATIEDRVDKLTHQLIYLQEQLDRVAKVSREWFPAGVDFDLPAPKAGYGFRWNATADAYEEVEFTAGAAVTTNKWTELTDTPSALVANEFVKANAGGTALEFVAGPGSEVLHVREELASGNNAGATVATTWTIVPLNTQKRNTITGASLATDQVTLPAGTYEVWGSSPLHHADQCKLRLRDTTGAATLLSGRNTYNDNVDSSPSEATLFGFFTLSVTSVLELQYYAALAKPTDGLGIAVSSGEVEVYGDLFFRKV